MICQKCRRADIFFSNKTLSASLLESYPRSFFSWPGYLKFGHPLWPSKLQLHDTQRFADFGERIRGAQQVFAFVRGADDGAQAGFAFRNRGVADRWSEHARIEKLARKLEGFCGFADMNGNDGRVTGLELESAFFQFAFEEFCIGPQFFDQAFAFRRIEQRESSLAGCCCGGWM